MGRRDRSRAYVPPVERIELEADEKTVANGRYRAVDRRPHRRGPVERQQASRAESIPAAPREATIARPISTTSDGVIRRERRRRTSVPIISSCADAQCRRISR